MQALPSSTLAETPLVSARTDCPNPEPKCDSKCDCYVFNRGTCFDEGYQPNTYIWGNIEYLYWWSRNAPVSVPLVTTGSVSDPVPGAIGQPNTSILFGNHSINNHGQSGFRIALRSWFGCNKSFGIEGSGFYLPKKSRKNFSRSSEADGLPILGVPFINVSPFPLDPNNGWVSINNSGETALLAANGVDQFGSISVSSSTQLWSVELNGLFNFLNKSSFKLSTLLGFIYLDLKDTLRLDFRSLPIATPLAIFRYTTITDRFRTHNEFYGGQIGLRGELCGCSMFLNFIAKLGFGATREIVDINGNFSDPNPNLYVNFGTGQGGIFAQPSNIGKHKKTKFAVLPEITVRFGVNLLRSLRLSVGYDFLYLSSVVRPGKQIDRNINESQVGPAPGGVPPTLIGPSRPKPLHNTTGYWAQGINAGIEFRL